jgi:hypothetical protein
MFEYPAPCARNHPAGERLLLIVLASVALYAGPPATQEDGACGLLTGPVLREQVDQYQ